MKVNKTIVTSYNITDITEAEKAGLISAIKTIPSDNVNSVIQGLLKELGATPSSNTSSIPVNANTISNNSANTPVK